MERDLVPLPVKGPIPFSHGVTGTCRLPPDFDFADFGKWLIGHAHGHLRAESVDVIPRHNASVRQPYNDGTNRYSICFKKISRKSSDDSSKALRLTLLRTHLIRVFPLKSYR
uniref:Metallophosphoesterase n=1 Tax=Panagrellus redivivus TaxID=6233 RepID=A0A7E4VUJ4_PANRE